MKTGMTGRRRTAVLGVAALAALLAGRHPLGTYLTGLYFAPLPGPAAPPEGEPWSAEELTFPGPDEALLEGWWFPARGPGPAKAVVLFAHGNYGHLEKQWRRTAELAASGLHVLMFDYRGFGDSPGRASRPNAREDLLAALEHARERARAEGLPVVVLGQSMGAALALEALGGRDDVAALVVDAPFSSWARIASFHLAPKPWLEPVLRPAFRLVLGPTGREPVDVAPSLRMPVLVIGCGEDEVTPAFMARDVAEAANARLLMLDEAGHPGRRTEEMERRVLEAQAAFILDAVARRADGR